MTGPMNITPGPPRTFGCTSIDSFRSDTLNSRLSKNQLIFAGAVPIGSHPLKVAGDRSDYDFAILRSDFNTLTDSEYEKLELDITPYFTAYPRTGHNTMLHKLPIEEGLADIIILEHKQDVEIIRSAMRKISGAPKSTLHNKNQRIALFEEELLKRGFKEPWQRRLAKWLVQLGSKDHRTHTSIRRF